MAGGGGGPGPVEPGFLDAPTFTLCAVLACFLAISMAFERSTHWLIRFLKRRKRNGLAQAVTNLCSELTLVGFVSLLLSVLQQPISSICVPFNQSTYETWNLISNVKGCDCCLSHTATVGSCFQKARSCGPGYCNCDEHDPGCLYEDPTLSAILSEWRSDPTCAANTTCGAAYLERAAGSPQAQVAADALSYRCEGAVKVDFGKCGEGMAPLISVTAQHQIHIFIFCVAAAHVLLGCIMVLLSSWRVRLWHKSCGDEDDEHAAKVRSILDSRRSRSTANAAGSSEPGRWRQLALTARHVALLGSRRPQARSISLPAALSAPTQGFGQGGAAAAAPAAEQPSSVAIQMDDAGAQAGAATGPAPQPDESGSSVGPGKLRKGSSSGSSSHGAEEEAASPPQLPGSTAGGGGEAQQGSSGAPQPAAAEEAGQPQQQKARRALLARAATLKRGDHVGWAREWAACLLLQAHPSPVSPEDIRLMRASFMLTHRVPSGFDFWRYVNDSMEDDFSEVVGVSLEMWVTMIILVLISGPLGWAPLLGLCLAAALLLVVNAKLVQIMRHVCRGCRVNELSSHYFWFNRPSLLLHPIKFVLFLCSFVFGSTIFFVWSFGASSCPLTSHSNAFWFAWPAPWWISLLAAAAIFLDASARTLPSYSLAVQMGSEFKSHMLPKNVRETLLAVAASVKAKQKAQQRAAALAEGRTLGAAAAAVADSAKNILPRRGW